MVASNPFISLLWGQFWWGQQNCVQGTWKWWLSKTSSSTFPVNRIFRRSPEKLQGCVCIYDLHIFIIYIYCIYINMYIPFGTRSNTNKTTIPFVGSLSVGKRLYLLIFVSLPGSTWAHQETLHITLNWTYDLVVTKWFNSNVEPKNGSLVQMMFVFEWRNEPCRFWALQHCCYYFNIKALFLGSFFAPQQQNLLCLRPGSRTMVETISRTWVRWLNLGSAGCFWKHIPMAVTVL